MSIRFLLGLTLFIAPLAQAKSLKKMNDGELITIMLHSPNEDSAVDATQMLQDRLSIQAIPAYGEVCQQRSARQCEYALSALEDLLNPQALDVVFNVISTPQLDSASRRKAAIILAKQDAGRLIPVIPSLCGTGVPAACQQALKGLGRLKTNGDAQAQISEVVYNTSAVPKSRMQALNIAGVNNFSNLSELTSEALRGYLVHSKAFTLEGILWAENKTLKENGDLLIYMVTDEKADRMIRVKALKIVEKWNHPGLPSAYLAMVKDSDKKIRKKSVIGLGRIGLPGDTVRPVLEQVVRTEKKGDIRAAALKSLKFYGHPSLLPLLHQEVMNERHPMAWEHAMTLLMVLADPSSIPTLSQMLIPSYELSSEARVMVIHTLVRLNATSTVPTLNVLANATVDSDLLVSSSASEAALLLGASASQRSQSVDQWFDGVDVIINETTVHEVPMPFVDMRFDENGFALTIQK